MLSRRQRNVYLLRERYQSENVSGEYEMIRLVVEMSDKTYQDLERGIDVGLFEISLDTLDRFGVKIVDKRKIK